jgi:hypothetical protein
MIAAMAEAETVGEWPLFAHSGRPRWCRNHMWTAPACKGFEYRLGDLVGCSHMSGPLVRRIWPLALMEFADRVPIKTAR